MGISYNSNIVTDGLVLCLDAANPRSYPGSGSTWYDVSISKRIGSINAATFVDSNGGIIDFDGTNSYVDISNVRFSITSNNISVELWIYQDAIVTNSDFGDQVNLFELPASQPIGSVSCFFFPLRGESIHFRYQRETNQAQVSPSANQEINTWHHYVGTSDSNYISLYKDGELVGSNPSSYEFTALSTSNNNARLGETGVYNKHYNGKMSGVRVYNRALTASEIQQNYNATRGRYGY